MKGKKQRKIIDIQMGRTGLYEGLSEIKKWNYSDVKDSLLYISKINNKYFKKFNDSLLPSKYEQLETDGCLEYEPENLEKELIWVATIINTYADKINMYNQFKSQYEIYLLNGEYVKAKEVLDMIEEQICFSVWGLENRFILGELSNGLEGNKGILANINKKNCSQIIKVLAEMYSFKAEHGVNNRQFQTRIKKILRGAEKNFKPYFQEKFYPLYNISVKDIYSILYYLGDASVIDLYNSYLKICIMVMVNDAADIEIKNYVTKSISCIDNIDNITVNKFRYYNNMTEDYSLNDIDKKMFEVMNLYTEGLYDQVISRTNILLIENSNIFELYEYNVKAHIMLNKHIDDYNSGCLREKILFYMHKSYVKDKNYINAYNNIALFARLFLNSSFGYGINRFMVDKFVIGNSKILVRAAEYYSYFFNARAAQLSEKIANNICSILENNFGMGSGLYLTKFLYCNDNLHNGNNIEKDRLRWYTIKKISQNNREEACKKLQEWYSVLETSNQSYSVYFKERISTELYYLFIANNMILQAEELYVSNTINNAHLTLRMDIEKIVIKLKRPPKEIKSSICTPILVYMYDQTKYSKIYSATANFLYNNSFEKPSDLIAVESNYEREKLIFFLKYVCSSDVLDSHKAFKNDEEVEEERIVICRFLQMVDGANDNEYIEEISQIMQKRKIIKGIKYLDEVKIDLDYEKIKSEEIESFGDSYKRYLKIGKLDIEYKMIDISNGVLFFKKDVENTKYNHKLMIFKEMFFDYRNILAFGKYGVDRSLGTRIRHGRLQNQIRIIFEKNQIIFAKKNSIEGYKPSKQFETLCKYMDDSDKQLLYENIVEFSEKIDLFIEELKSEYIRIRTEEEYPKGLIDFTVDFNILNQVFESLKQYTDGQIVMEQFEIFWIQRLGSGLNIARNFFDNDVKNYFISCINSLEEKLHGINTIDLLEINIFDLISRSRTDIQTSIKSIKEWFKLPTDKEYSNYTLDDLLEICETINNNAFAKFNQVKMKTNLEPSVIILGKTFSYLVDILIILFTNAYYHSGYSEEPSNLVIELSIFIKNDNMHISMENNIAETVNKDEEEATIQQVSTRLDECINTCEYVNTEGHSGYIKICKILDYNIICNWTLDFGLNSNKDKFYTNISIGKNYILMEEDS